MVAGTQSPLKDGTQWYYLALIGAILGCDDLIIKSLLYKKFSYGIYRHNPYSYAYYSEHL